MTIALVAGFAACPAPATKAEEALQLAVGQTELESFKPCEQCPEMVPLPQGRFIMGSAEGDSSEQPTHAVQIGHSFAIGRFEVRVSEWMACVEAKACDYEPDGVLVQGLTAIRNVSWNDAQQYVAWLNGVSGLSFRLPSEAEWEYATRAGTTTAYWWGETAGGGEADCRDCGGVWSGDSPKFIGSHDANPFGLHDMNGGAAEWTADCWFDDYQGAPGDGAARDKADCRQRALRGGSWRSRAGYLRSAARGFYDADVRYLVHGFRVALTLQ